MSFVKKNEDSEHVCLEKFLTRKVMYCFQKFYKVSLDPVLDDNGMLTVEYSYDRTGENLTGKDKYEHKIIDIIISE